MPSNPVHEAAVKRVCRAAAKIPTETWAAGQAWYAAESDWIADEATARGFDPAHANMAFAALSPRVQYGHNRTLLLDLMNGESPKGLRRSWWAAHRALHNGEPPTGPKVSSFACNLNGCTECVTVDVWMSRMIGFPQPSNRAAYQRVEKAFQAAARRLNVAPRTLQAALWIYVRGVKASDPAGPYRNCA